MVICDNNTVWVFGRNNIKQLGLSHNNQVNEPVENNNLNGAVAISAIGQMSLQADGKLIMWNNISQPYMASFIQDVKMLGGFEIVLKKDSTVWKVSADAATKIQGLSDIIAVSNYFSHTLVLKSDGTVWGWGRNINGQLGDGTDSNSRETPMPVQGLTNVKAISTGANHSLALKNDGTVWAWGLNTNGQLGDNSYFQRNLPVQVAGNLSNVKAITAGGAHSLALKNDGTVWAWGSNGNGQLGTGNNTTSNIPVAVLNLSGVNHIGAGDDHSLALKTDGTFKSWGLNFFRQLGDGTTSVRNAPVDIINVCPEMQTNLTVSPYSSSQFEIYPNPMNQQLFINSQQNNISKNEIFEFILTDIHGRIITKLPLVDNKTVFERGNLSQGVYFYTIKNEHNFVEGGKLVVQ